MKRLLKSQNSKNVRLYTGHTPRYSECCLPGMTCNADIMNLTQSFTIAMALRSNAFKPLNHFSVLHFGMNTNV